MNNNEGNEREEESKTDSASETTCPICEGQGCECTSSDEKEEVLEKSTDQNIKENENDNEDEYLIQIEA